MTEIVTKVIQNEPTLSNIDYATECTSQKVWLEPRPAYINARMESRTRVMNKTNMFETQYQLWLENDRPWPEAE